MHPTFVADLATVLLVASFTGLLFRKLGQPSVLGYLLAGLIVGPYIPIPIFADPERIHALSEVGVVLVMFVVGLELRLERLARVLPTAGPMTLVEVTALLGTGFGIGRLFGWDTKAAVFLGASIAISSTMLVSKVFEDREVGPDVREHVMSMLVIQDVLAIVLAAVLTAVAAGEGLDAEAIGGVVGKLALVLAVILVVGLLVVPRLVRMVAGLNSPELLVVVCMGLCFGLALAAEAAGFSVALGAFFAGTLVAESGKGQAVEHLASPLRDTFAAIFFVAIGMTVDPQVAVAHLGTSLLIFVAVVIAQLLAVSVAGVLSGNGPRRSVTAGLSLGQVGEFGFILSAIGIDAGIAPPELGPIVVTVAVLTAFSTPLAVRSADGVVRALDHALPQKLQDVSSLYEQWFEAFRARKKPERSAIARSAWIAALDGVAATGLVVAAATFRSPLVAIVHDRFGLEPPWDAVVLWSATVVLALLPAVAFIHAARSLGVHTAERVFGPSSADPNPRRPRRLLEVAVQLLVVLVVGIPCAVVALPFAGGWLVLAIGVLALGTLGLLWRTAGQVAPQVQFSAERLVDLLSRQTAAQSGGATASKSDGILGLDMAHGVALDEHAHAVGRTLAELDLRAVTGATVVAIRNADDEHRLPTGQEPLAVGDVLALAGTAASIARARALLLEGER